MNFRVKHDVHALTERPRHLRDGVELLPHEAGLQIGYFRHNGRN